MKNIMIFFPLFTLVISLLISYIMKTRQSRKCSSKLKLPPSPPKLPIIGNLHQLGSHPHRSFRSLSEKYGPLMHLRIGTAPVLVVSSADAAKEIFKNHDEIFSNRPKTTAAKALLYDHKDIAFAKYGEYWKNVRKVCVFELLSLKRVKDFQFIRDEESASLVDKIRIMASEGSSVINLSEMLVSASNNVLSRCVFGKGFSEDIDGPSKFGELGRSAMTEMMTFSVGDFFPSLRWIDTLTGFIGRLRKIAREFDTFLDEVLEEHKAVLESGGGSGDFADILLNLQKHGSLDFQLSRDNSKAIMMDMFIGGSDTTSTTLEWMMAELIRNPSAMKKAQEEVRKVIGNKSKIDNDDVNKMNYLKCCIKETLRLHPPIPLLIPHETSAEIKVHGFRVPAKTRVFVNVWAIQRDPRAWDRAEDFMPERFEKKGVDFKGLDFNYFPFGSGRRGCPGTAFAISSIELVIANVLCWFDWKLPNLMSSEMDMDEMYGLVVHKKIPLHLVPIPYSP